MSLVTHGGSLLAAGLAGMPAGGAVSPCTGIHAIAWHGRNKESKIGIPVKTLLHNCPLVCFYLFGPQLLHQGLRKHYKIRHGPFSGFPASKKTPLPPLQSKITRKTGETASEIQTDSIF